MISYDFVVDKKRLSKRIKSDLQHKLRVALKCYTILNFILGEDRSFTFNAKYRHYSSKITYVIKEKDGSYKLYKGSYETQELDGDKIRVTINLDGKKEGVADEQKT